MFGSQPSFFAFLRRHAVLLNGIRMRDALRRKPWGVRCEGWSVLVRGDGEGVMRWGDKVGVAVGVAFKEAVSDTARAADLPTLMSR